MSRKHKIWLLVAVAGCGSTLAASLWAQQPADSPNASSSGRRYSAARPVQNESDADRSIARLLGNMNQVEVELTQYAEDRADLPAINRFARNQNRQHSMNLEELQQFASDAGANIGRSSDEDDRHSRTDKESGNHAAKDQNDRADKERAGKDQADKDHAEHSGKDHSAGLDWKKLSQEIANENLRVAKRELRERQGLDFDWAFVGQQKMLHDAMCANMTVLRRYASPDLQKVIDNQLDGVRHDQTTLENLMGQLKVEEQRRYAGMRQRPDRGASTAPEPGSSPALSAAMPTNSSTPRPPSPPACGWPKGRMESPAWVSRSTAAPATA